MQFFSRLMPRENRFFDLFNQHAQLVVAASALLSELLTGFTREADKRDERIAQIVALEHRADRVMRAALSQLFRGESDIRQLIKLETVYQLLESATDRCADVANIIEGVVLENA